MTREAPPEGEEAPKDPTWARWRWVLFLVVLVFVLNNLVGIIVGGLGLVAFVHQIAGRAVRAGRLAQEVRHIVADPRDD